MTLAQQIRQASQGMWADAHRPGGLARNELQAEIVMAELIALTAKDPVACAGSWFGGLHLSKYWFLLSDADFAVSLRAHAKNVLANGEAETPEQKAEMKRFIDHADDEVRSRQNPYPYRFELKDVLLESREILMQLVADEYFMGGPESTPFTPEAFTNSRVQKWTDPFSTYERPDVTVEVGGQMYNEGGAIVPKPKEGFREIA